LYGRPVDERLQSAPGTVRGDVFGQSQPSLVNEPVNTEPVPISNRPSFLQRTENYLGQTLPNQISAGLSEAAMGALESAGVADVQDYVRRLFNPDFVPGQAEQKQGEANSQVLSPTVQKTAGFGGTVAGLLLPTLGAFKTGGQLA